MDHRSMHSVSSFRRGSLITSFLFILGLLLFYQDGKFFFVRENAQEGFGVLGGFIALVSFLSLSFFLPYYFMFTVSGEYWWLYVMPDQRVLEKEAFDENLFRSSQLCLRMKNGGWRKTSCIMHTPHEGERIDRFATYDPVRSTMTLKLTCGEITAPLNVAIRILSIAMSDQKNGMVALVDRMERCGWRDEEARVFYDVTSDVLSTLPGDTTKRSSKRIRELNERITAALKLQLPKQSHFLKSSVLVGEDPGIGALADALEASAEDAEKDPTPANKS